MKRMIPFGVIIWLYIVVFCLSTTLFIIRGVMEELFLQYVLLGFVAIYCLYWIVRAMLSYQIFYDDEKIMMKNDFTLIFRNKIQFYDEVKFKDIKEGKFSILTCNSCGVEKIGRRSGIKKYLEITTKDGKTHLFYVTNLSPLQQKKLAKHLNTYIAK